MATNLLDVSIKMYKVGELGDCFLLRFTHEQQTSHLLLDCGSFRNSAKSIKRMGEVWKDISTDLSGKTLDVVVGTHQHNDHMSGFVHGESDFRKLGAKSTWLSWLDDPKDSTARGVREEQEKALTAVANLSKKLSGSALFKGLDVTEKVAAILGFSDPVIPARGLKILQSTGETVRYLDPGEIVPLPGMEKEVRIFVLGPPKDKEKLKDIRPSAGESYDPHLAAASMQATKMLSAISNFETNANDDDQWAEEHFPFTRHFKLSMKDFEQKAKEEKTGKQKAKASKRCESVWSAYTDRKNDWRNIDDDWLDEAGNLALYMDRYTNNTSLVLAFQLVRTGKFLLFVGDAQTGNWNSWKGITWRRGKDKFSTSDLLNNTILYKVGHHCSHNATTIEGLEAMTDPDLVAMIPVDVTDPNITPPSTSKRKGWKMPATNLYKRLQEKTNNRIIRMDTGVSGNTEVKGRTGKRKWKNLSTTHELTETDLYLQYSFSI